MREQWTTEIELLTQILEVVSVTASGRQLRKPVQVKRPAEAKKGGGRTAGGQVLSFARPQNSPEMAGAVSALRSSMRSSVRTG